MLRGTHITGGMAVCACLAGFLDPPQTSGVAAVALGSVLPDILDHKQGLAFFRKVLKPLFGSFAAELIVGTAQRAVNILQDWLDIKHRGFLHSVAFMSILCALAISSGSSLMGWLCQGYASHLLLDSCTPRGIPLIGLSPKGHRLRGKIVTGSRAEMFIAGGLLVLTFSRCCQLLLMQNWWY